MKRFSVPPAFGIKFKAWDLNYSPLNSESDILFRNEVGELSYVTLTDLKSNTRNFGQFYDTTTQSGSANTAYSMKLNTTDFASGMSIISGSQITVTNSGTYNLQFSAQLGNTSNTTIDFDIWLSKNGQNVDNTNTQLTLTKQPGSLGRQVAAWNFLIQLNAGEYTELMWNCDASTGQIQYQGTQTTPNRPAIPSLIVTMTQVG